MLVFGLGGFTCILSILRLESIYAAVTTTDAIHDSSLAALWSILEVDSGILCSCLPTLKAPVAKFLPGLLGQTSYPRGTRTRTKTNGLSHVERSIGVTSLRAPAAAAMVSYGGQESPGDEEDLGQSPKEIRVVTVVHQEIDPAEDDAARSESGSTRDLIHRVSVSE